MVAISPSEPVLSAASAIAALAGDDNQTRYYAAWWLGKHQVQEACGDLCHALQDERYRTEQGGYPLRRQAARALGLLKNPQAIPALRDSLSCPDLRFREAVIQSLAILGDRAIVPQLMEFLTSDTEQPYEVVIEALGTLQAKEAFSLVAPFLHHSSERVQCAAARYAYLITQEAQYIERIIKNLSHENMYLRWAAAFDLGAIGHQASAQAIIHANLGSSLKLLNLKHILETILNDRAMQEDIPTDEELKQENIQILLQAIDDLLLEPIALGNDRARDSGNLAEADLIASLIADLHDHHPKVTKAAIDHLVQLAPGSVEPLMNAFATCLDHGIQAHIIEALAKIGDRRTLDLFIQIVGVEVANHCQGTIRRTAARGLGKISGNLEREPSQVVIEEIIKPAIVKLDWALFHAEDWALRYGAIVSLEEIAKIAPNLVKTSLKNAANQEDAIVVKTRLQKAIATL
jgi:HEAT repeat protein